MKVVDTERSERGKQRRKTAEGRLLHCCCICGQVSPWGDSWSAFCSDKDLDDGVPIPKFCSEACRQKGGSKAELVSKEMKETAKGAELREPNLVYREATETEKYADAAYAQQQRPRS